MLKYFIYFLGRILSITPVFIVQFLTWTLGGITYYSMHKRRRIMLSNLYYAFPKKTQKQRAQIAITSLRRMIEMALLVLASPFWSDKRIKKNFSLSAQATEIYSKIANSANPHLFLTPHFALMEALTFLPKLYGENKKQPELGVLYRPSGNKDLDDWIKRSRERHGVKMLSRKEGFNQAIKMLKGNGMLTILFDQNAGSNASLNMFFNRPTFTTDLPGILAHKFQCETFMTYTQRKGFWKGIIEMEVLETPKDKASVTLRSNDWLADKLRNDEELCQDWLWAHKRWDLKRQPLECFNILNPKKSQLEAGILFDLQSKLPRTANIFIRLPNWLGDVVMTIPLIRAIRASRPECAITLIGKGIFLSLLKSINLADNFIALPPKGAGYFKFFRKLRDLYPEIQVQFTNSIRGDMEAFLIGARQRIGIQRPGKLKPILTHTWSMPKSLNEQDTHQTFLWEQYLKHFRLELPLDLSPLEQHEKPQRVTVGMIAGSENAPQKRWPINHWRSLIELTRKKHPEALIKLLGTANDKAIADKIAEGFEGIENLAGKTNLQEFITELQSCTYLVCNDTGGMHLANAYGVPTIGIFGPTNPIRTGPVFDSPKVIIQPDNAPKHGGVDISAITPDQVSKACNKL